MARLGRGQPFKPLIQRPLSMRLRVIQLTETAVIVDSFVRTVSKQISETITLVDGLVKTFSRSLSEFLNIRDGWGKAMTFDGVNDYARSSIILPSTGFTIEFWFTPSKFVTNDRVIDQSEAGPTNGFNCTITATNRLQATFFNGASVVASLVTSVLTAGEKRFISVSSDGTIAKLYVDGSFVTQDTSAAFTESAQAFTVGRRSAASANFAGFSMDELRVYFAELSAATIANHALNRFDDESSLRLYWDFDAISGTTIPDKSGYGNDGTIFPNTTIGPQLADSFVLKSITYASGLLLNAGKVLSESVTIVDTFTRIASKVYTDSLVLVDSISNMVGKMLSEVVTIVDTCIAAFTLFLNEILLIEDACAKGLSRALDDALAVVDSFSKGANKALNEVVTLEEALVRAISRGLTETLTIVETFTKSKLIRGLIRGIAKRTNTIFGSVSDKSVQRGKSTSTNTKRGSSL